MTALVMVGAAVVSTFLFLEEAAFQAYDRADDAFDAAEAAHDIAGMNVALAAMRNALCGAPLPTGLDCAKHGGASR